jgi:hypothetical protein
VQPLGLLQKKNEKLHCECLNCETRRFEKSAVGRARNSHKDRNTYADPLMNCSDSFVQRIKVLKQYDIETAKQEQFESKKKKKKKV